MIFNHNDTIPIQQFSTYVAIQWPSVLVYFWETIAKCLQTACFGVRHPLSTFCNAGSTTCVWRRQNVSKKWVKIVNECLFGSPSDCTMSNHHQRNKPIVRPALTRLDVTLWTGPWFFWRRRHGTRTVCVVFARFCIVFGLMVSRRPLKFKFAILNLRHYTQNATLKLPKNKTHERFEQTKYATMIDDAMKDLRLIKGLWKLIRGSL